MKEDINKQTKGAHFDTGEDDDDDGLALWIRTVSHKELSREQREQQQKVEERVNNRTATRTNNNKPKRKNHTPTNTGKTHEITSKILG